MNCKTSYGFNRSAYAGYIFHQIVTKLNFKLVERKGEQVIPIYMDKHFIQIAQSNEDVDEIYKVEIWEQVAEIFDQMYPEYRLTYTNSASFGSNFVDFTVKEKVVRMTLHDIEKKLGHKVELIQKYQL